MVLGKDRKSLASFSGLKVVGNEKIGRIGKESNVRILNLNMQFLSGKYYFLFRLSAK